VILLKKIIIGLMVIAFVLFPVIGTGMRKGFLGRLKFWLDNKVFAWYHGFTKVMED